MTQNMMFIVMIKTSSRRKAWFFQINVLCLGLVQGKYVCEPKIIQQRPWTLEV